LYRGTGRRKTAVARVRLLPGDGKITVNGRDYEDYFPRPAYRAAARAPLELLGAANRYDVVAKIEGGGPTGQADALRHGIARALAEESQEARGELKAAGLLTRDSRAVERKKYGLKKARKRPQFSKR
jgi:small subunit ribosomal protein S9